MEEKSMALLEFQNVSKSYDNVTKALSDITFFIEKGEFVSIIGPSGAGKSTLAQMASTVWLMRLKGPLFLMDMMYKRQARQRCARYGRKSV